MDEPGRIDARRYPAFAELASSSTWFPYATTVADGTTDAVPALLTGELPARDSVPNAVDHPDNLFTLLGGSYRLNVTEDATELCPARLCGGRDLESFRERIGSLTKDLSIVSGHLVLPDSLRDRSRRSTSRSRTSAAATAAREQRRPGGRCRPRASTPARPRSIPSSSRSTGGLAACTSCTCWCRTSPGSCCPRGSATRPTSRPSATASWTPRAAGTTSAGSSSTDSSATCSRSATPTGPSAR